MIQILTVQEATPLFSNKDDRLREAKEIVKRILDSVEARGDAAVREFATEFDGFDRPSFLVGRDELADAEVAIALELKSAIENAAENIRSFATMQMPKEFMTELAPGHIVGQVVRPIETVAAYIPGGRYPLPSTVLMTCIPAFVAGVPNVWVVTPKPDETVLAAAQIAGATNVALIGGAQAIAAFAFGTETIPKASRIVGPGNVYVSAAKQLLAGQVGIDFIAGPTEVVILANEGNASWIAADMLAQAEHDLDACAFLITTSRPLAEAVAVEIDRQLESLATAAIASLAIDRNSAIVLCESDDQAIDLANQLAAEHLCVPDSSYVPRIRNAGSIFVGPYSPEAAGDYVTGPNHVLPTSGRANLSGGLSVHDFVKIITVQQLSQEALAKVGRDGALLARAEGLEGHARSIEVRLNA